MGWVKMATGLFVLDRGSITDDIDTSPTTMMRTGLTHGIKGHTETRKIHLGTSQEKERFRKRKELGRLGGKYETNSHSPRHRHHLNNRAYIITQRVVPERNETTRHRISSSQDWWGTAPTRTREIPRAPRSRDSHRMPDDPMEKGHTMTKDENFTWEQSKWRNDRSNETSHGRRPRNTGLGTVVSARSGYWFKRETGEGVADAILWEVLVGPYAS